MKRRFIYIVTLLQLFGGILCAQEQLKVYDDSWALVIGINNYTDKKFPARKYGSADALGIAEVLTALQFPQQNIHTLTNGQATLAGIRAQLADLSAKIKSNDRLFIFWGADAVTRSIGGADMAFLVPYDAKSNAPDNTCISLEEMKNLQSKMQAKHIFLIIDDCIGGLPNAPLRGTTIKEKISNRGFQVMAAGKKNEKHSESWKAKHSVFTKALLDGFWRGNLDGDKNNFITLNELFEYVANNVGKLAGEVDETATRPVVVNYGGTEGEFVFPTEKKAFTFILKDLPAKNKVFIAGKKASEDQKMLKKTLEEGTYQVDVVSPGLKTFSTVVHLSGPQTIAPKLDSVFAYKLETNPAGATVTIDSTDAGTTPFVKELTLGEHTVRITKDGYEPLTFTTTVKRGENYDLKTLVPFLKYTLTVAGLPDSSIVTIDGKMLSQGVGLIKYKLKPGTYAVDVRAKGYESYSQSVEMKSDVTIYPEMAVVVPYTLETDPPGVTAIIDDKDAGTTPLTTNLKLGGHIIRLSKPEYIPATVTAVVSKQKAYDKFTLHPLQLDSARIAGDVTNVSQDSSNGKSAGGEFHYTGSAAYFTFDIRPKDAELFIDDRKVNTTDGKAIHRVYAGRRTVVISKEGYEIYKEVFDLNEGDTKTVVVDLKSTARSTWWIYAGGGIIVGGTALLLYINHVDEKPERDPYGNPPGFPVNP